jgi:hypothetical protein
VFRDGFRNFKDFLLNVRSLVNLMALVLDCIQIGENRSTVHVMALEVFKVNEFKAITAPGVWSDLMDAGPIETLSQHCHGLNPLHRLISPSSHIYPSCYGVKGPLHLRIVPELGLSN